MKTILIAASVLLLTLSSRVHAWDQAAAEKRAAIQERASRMANAETWSEKIAKAKPIAQKPMPTPKMVPLTTAIPPEYTAAPPKKEEPAPLLTTKAFKAQSEVRPHPTKPNVVIVPMWMIEHTAKMKKLEAEGPEDLEEKNRKHNAEMAAWIKMDKARKAAEAKQLAEFEARMKQLHADGERVKKETRQPSRPYIPKSDADWIIQAIEDNRCDH